MKTNKALILISGLFLFVGSAFATQPGSVDAKVSAQKMVAKIDKEVELTDSQKAALQAKAEIFISKMQEANNLSDKNTQSTQRTQLQATYKAALDSILTDSQKTLRLEKQEARRKDVENKHK